MIVAVEGFATLTPHYASLTSARSAWRVNRVLPVIALRPSGQVPLGVSENGSILRILKGSTVDPVEGVVDLS
jgi:hypothetical protein